MTKRLLAKRVRKLLVFSCAFALSVIITAVSTSANSYDASDALLGGIMGSPSRSNTVSGFQASGNDDYSAYSGWVYDNSDDAEYISYTDQDYSGWALEDIPDAVRLDMQKEVKKNKQEKKSGEFTYRSEIPLNEELQLYTFEQCRLHDLDYELVLALMWRESRFQTDAVGYNSNGTSDSGIMQINDINRKWIAKELGITDLLDPMNNIQAGTYLLGRLTKKYGEHNALMAYQYGETGMERKLSQGVTTNKQIQLLYTKRDYFENLSS